MKCLYFFFFFESTFCKYRKVLVRVSLVAFPCTCFVSSKYRELKPACKTTSVFALYL